MNNLSYIVVIFLFAGMVWVGVDKREGIKQAAIDKAQAIEDEKNASVLFISPNDHSSNC